LGISISGSKHIFTSILIQRMCIIQQHTIVAKGIFDPIVINYFKKLPFIGYGSKGSIRHTRAQLNYSRFKSNETKVKLNKLTLVIKLR